ncbi:MAG: hypothetical protein ABJE95_00575 [Byssovorax sp.]
MIHRSAAILLRAPLATIGALALLSGPCGCADRSGSPSPETQSSPTAASSDVAIKSESESPLQSWMKGTATPALISGSPEVLARLFDRIEGLDPPGYPGWKSIAGEGAASARAGDVEGCRLACKSCHDQHRQAYRAKDRARPLR